MKTKIKINYKWIVRTFFLTFSLAILFGVISEALLSQFNVVVAFALLIFIIMIGVFFDAIGIAVTAADERPFHAMAAANIKSAKYSANLIKNASKVSNFCNDVIGDISGIISGTTIGIIIGFFEKYDFSSEQQVILSIVISGMVAGLTVGGKAIGKEIAMYKSKEVVNMVGQVIYFFKVTFTLGTYTSLFKRRK